VAKELEVPVLALSQLSRAVESRPGVNGKRPMLSDLRESGSIEQDADMVLFLYRPEYYGITEDEQGRSQAGVGEVIIAKHRNGETGIVPLKFIGKFVKFADLDEDFNPPNSFSADSPSSGMYPSQDFEKQSNVIIRPSKMDDYNSDDDPPF
jgi:replicative DNA helicase